MKQALYNVGLSFSPYHRGAQDMGGWSECRKKWEGKNRKECNEGTLRDIQTYLQQIMQQ
jgi:hypothetical protein